MDQTSKFILLENSTFIGFAHVLVSVKGLSLPHDLLPKGRDAYLGLVLKGGWCSSECLFLGPHGCLEAMAPKNQSAACDVGRGASPLDG